tara:strand:+ start:1669 stop:2013 length:345 start_codon:yes stop_codon:yes gene_type:complete
MDKITESFEIKSGFTKFNYIKGEIHPLVKIKKGFEIYYKVSNYKDGRYWGIAVNINKPNEVFPILVSSIGVLAKLNKYNVNNKLKKTGVINLCDDCYQLEFIYNGKIGNIVKFT